MDSNRRKYKIIVNIFDWKMKKERFKRMKTHQDFDDQKS